MSYQYYTSYENSGAPTSSDIAGLTANATTINGSTNFITGTGTDGSTGALINSSANPVTTNSGPVDASGGNGSIPSALQNIATQGLNDAVTSANEFGLGSLTDLLRVSSQGTTTAAAAPSPQGNTLTSSGIPTWIYLVGGAVVLLLIMKAVK
jgi:hypothetical protein